MSSRLQSRLQSSANCRCARWAAHYLAKGQYSRTAAERFASGGAASVGETDAIAFALASLNKPFLWGELRTISVAKARVRRTCLRETQF